MKTLFLICLLALFLRLYQLGSNPPSLTWDEVAWGYNAYSLGIDGRDEFGKLLPYSYIESFGDFKPVVYAYLDIIPIKIFGLTEFAVRFPSAILGTVTVFVTYFLVKRIFLDNTSVVLFKKIKLDIPLLSCFILAISPWHINLSRAAFEANVATFFIVLSVWSFLKAIQHNKNFLIVSVISFFLAFQTFNSARIVGPLLFFTLIVRFRKDFLRSRKAFSLAFLLGIILFLPILPFLLSPQSKLRFKEVNIFSDIGVIRNSNQQINNDNNAWWSKIIHNRRIEYGKEFLHHYFDNLSPNFLFIKGDGNPKFSTQDVGELYIWELPFFIGGILFLFRKRIGNWWIVPVWLIASIIPAAIARETPHALRIESALPTFQIISAYGILHVLKVVKEKLSDLRFQAIVVALMLMLAFNFLYYFHGYYVHYPAEYSGEWQYGYKESITFIRSVEKNFDEIHVSTSFGRPYIYYLFYTQTDPIFFRKTERVERDVFGFVNVKSFGKYFFERDFSAPKHGRKILYVNTPQNVPQNASILKTFYLLNGNPAMVAYRF